MTVCTGRVSHSADYGSRKRCRRAVQDLASSLANFSQLVHTADEGYAQSDPLSMHMAPMTVLPFRRIEGARFIATSMARRSVLSSGSGDRVRDGLADPVLRLLCIDTRTIVA